MIQIKHYSKCYETQLATSPARAHSETRTWNYLDCTLSTLVTQHLVDLVFSSSETEHLFL